jgi:hypothetical protein
MNRLITRGLIGLGICSALTISGSALALATRTGTNVHTEARSTAPFDNISALAGTGPTIVDPETAARVRQLNAKGVLAGQEIGQARAFNTTIAGRTLYAIPSSRGDLCVFLAQAVETCTGPLAASNPAVFTVFDRDGPGGTGPTAFGVAMDGVRSVSFDVNGQPQTLPVRNNIFEYAGTPSTNTEDFTAPSVTFSDGTTVPLR